MNSQTLADQLSTQRQRQLFVISAPSGAGKTSLVKALLASLPDLKVSISYTTRPKRKEEKNGEHYWFITAAEFDRMQQADDFLESAEVFNHGYATSKSWVAQTLARGSDVILEIDWQGAARIRELFPDAISIFILPPSLAVLKTRLESRKQDSQAVIAKRLQGAMAELAHCVEFDYLLVNDVFADALSTLKGIIESSRLKTRYCRSMLPALLAAMQA